MDSLILTESAINTHTQMFSSLQFGNKCFFSSLLSVDNRAPTDVMHSTTSHQKDHPFDSTQLNSFLLRGWVCQNEIECVIACERPWILWLSYQNEMNALSKSRSMMKFQTIVHTADRDLIVIFQLKDLDFESRIIVSFSRQKTHFTWKQLLGSYFMSKLTFLLTLRLLMSISRWSISSNGDFFPFRTTERSKFVSCREI